jgi:transcriptional regulator with XRE-family HTH domain
MTCEVCNTKIVERMATLDSPYHYAMCGLKDVFLAGITIRRCIKCATESPVIPRISELHKVIAESIVEQPDPLKGDQLRYLRKYAGFSSKRFAALLEVSAAHLSRFENGVYATLAGPTDKLARALAMSATDQKYTQKILMQVADDRIRARKIKPTFKLIKNRWIKAAA